MKLILKTIAFCFLMLGNMKLPAQDSAATKKKASSKVNKAARDLQNSLSTKDEKNIAAEYESLAAELVNEKAFTKAEGYLKQAITIYTRLNDKEALANARRQLGKLQETQAKVQPAILNYEAAAKEVGDTLYEQLNLNDADRLRNSSPREQEQLIQRNIELLEDKGKKEEMADAYKQLAETQLKQNNTSGAVVNFNKAIANSIDKESVYDIRKKISQAYLVSNKYDSAIAVIERTLKQSVESGDTYQQLNLLQELGGTYLQNKMYDKALVTYQNAYKMAMATGNTRWAALAAQSLAGLYQQQKDITSSLSIYNDFLNHLDTVLKKDSSLVDAKIFDITEARIIELENEKRLQAELILRKNRFNYVLAGSLLLLAALLLILLRAWWSISIKNKKIALQSLRREMNPHFIFNSLNSVNQYIAQNDELEANRFLSNYSGLMRNVLENSNRDFVPLSTELEQLKKYLSLEHQRFKEKFDYEFYVDPAIDPDAIMVPNMLLQPHLENAIWHGLRYKNKKGLLNTSFQLARDILVVTVEDDGIGLRKSQELKTQHQKEHQSRGLSNTRERIQLLNNLYKTDITMQMEDIDSDEGGTRVVLSIPIMYKNHRFAKN